MEPRTDWNIYTSPFSASIVDRTEPISEQIEFDIDKNVIFNQNEIFTFLPTDNEFLDYFKKQGVFSFHYYDPQTISSSLINRPDDMNKKNCNGHNFFRR
jgi:hypothetical protein